MSKVTKPKGKVLDPPHNQTCSSYLLFRFDIICRIVVAMLEQRFVTFSIVLNVSVPLFGLGLASHDPANDCSGETNANP